MLFHRKGNTKYHNNKILDNFSSMVLCHTNRHRTLLEKVRTTIQPSYR